MNEAIKILRDYATKTGDLEVLEIAADLETKAAREIAVTLTVDECAALVLLVRGDAFGESYRKHAESAAEKIAAEAKRVQMAGLP